jgi:sugar phosphate isomerase/epimerase
MIPGMDLSNFQIALQLYSAREALARDFDGALNRIAAMGYRDVETAFFPEGMDDATAAAHLRRHGLRPIAAHVALPIGDQRDAVLRAADTFGVTRIVWHGWPRDARYDTREGWQRLADEYNSAAENARKAGLTLGLHNHWWEIEPLNDERPYLFLRDHVSPDVFFELDGYWARVAGADPAQVARDLGSRLKLLHIKDGPLTRHDPMCALGTGALDIPALLKAAAGQIDYVIVELDECATDMLEALEASLRYLSSLG